MSTDQSGWPHEPDRRERRARIATAVLRVLLPVSVGASYLLLGWRGVVVAFVVAVIALTYSLTDYQHRLRRGQRERHLAERQSSRTP